MRTIQSIVAAFALAALVAHASKTTPPLPRSASTGSLGRVQGNGPPSTPPSPTSSRTDSAEITKKSKKRDNTAGGSPSSSTSQSPALTRSGDKGKKSKKADKSTGESSSSSSNAQAGDVTRPPVVVPNAAVLEVPQTAFHYPTVSPNELQAPETVFTLEHQVVGILPQLHNALVEAKSTAFLVSPHTPFITQAGKADSSWGCGYHNLQVLLAPVVRLEKLGVTRRNKPVADRVGESPECPRLQTLINDARQKGFDRIYTDHGGKLNPTRVQGTARLETMEAAAALSYLGIKNMVYQFPPEKLMHFVEWYFTMAAKIDYGGDALKSQKVIVLSRPAIFLNYGRPGHSVSIVGFERLADGTKYLLLFDSLYASLDRTEGQNTDAYLKMFRKSLADLHYDLYDVVVVGDDKWTLGKVDRQTDGLVDPSPWAYGFQDVVVDRS